MLWNRRPNGPTLSWRLNEEVLTRHLWVWNKLQLAFKNSIKDKFNYVLIKSYKRFTELWMAVFLSLKSELLSEAFQLRFKRVVTEEWWDLRRRQKLLGRCVAHVSSLQTFFHFIFYVSKVDERSPNISTENLLPSKLLV